MKKLYADTNTFLRFLLQDNVKQAEIAEKKFALAKEKKLRVIIISEIIPELTYVLSGVYKLSRVETAKQVANILKTPYFDIKHRDTWDKVMDLYPQVNIDVVDIFLAVRANEEGGEVFSFDKDFEKIARLF
ncbi:MAG: PIN domain-containing protein [Candidatus Pacebacteria bacterium]|jgi:predicted nucleic-acid-binding protein|nr:PIN domain-containing protein [Candidatus Paceibacterota bacterium]MBT3512001.1 PIN domain-containing protein [Candidatus Paceibacterota bacterium]MBT4005323.1 PIN domain-containing protein [Candidatus Paceibacterota bacterium]MBT4358387.1 PIN domain-containing protein [Candidatus Paceibacterota bacterium]MBT4681269.1 PIN domain-containing protein [Candidatus Paceibacterota bacterium]